MLLEGIRSPFYFTQYVRLSINDVTLDGGEGEVAVPVKNHVKSMHKKSVTVRNRV